MRRVGISAMAGAAIAALAMAHPAAAREPHHAGRTRYPVGYRRYNRLPAGINRHTGQPHEHEREASRRLRQECVAELNRANRYLRAHGGLEIGFGDPLPEFGLTRSGRKVRL